MTIEQIRELYARINELTGEELDTLRAGIAEVAGSIEGENSVDNVALLNELADIGDATLARQEALVAEQAEAEQQATAARERIARLNGEPEPDADDDTTTAADDDDAADDTDADAGTTTAQRGVTEQVPAAVVASAPAPSPIAQMALRQPRWRQNPENLPARESAVLVASSPLTRRQEQPLTNRAELAEATVEVLNSLSKTQASGSVIVASARYRYPENRRLGRDAAQNGAIMERETGMQAIVASGGICAPTNVDYDVGTWATADRPLRAGLPSFEATRGGLLYVTPPDMNGLTGATSIWTEATDANPSGATKAVLAINCGSTVQVYVDAVVTRLQIGNMYGRFAPEQVAANTDLAIAAAARVAENNLMSKLSAASTVLGAMTNTKILGATRDFLACVYEMVAAFRWYHRLDPNVALTAILPLFLRDIMKVDLLREIGHDNAGARDVLQVTDAQIDELLNAAGIRPIWHMDGLAAATFGGHSVPLQGYAAPSAGAIPAFPTEVLWWMFPEGSVQFLDGGRLDLGVVRDATLDATNDYETFVETFEGIATRGFANSVVELSTALCANGGTAGTLSTSESACA